MNARPAFLATPLDAARGMLARGWMPVYVPPGRKGPVTTDWQNVRYTEDTLATHFNGVGNLGVMLGEPSGWLVDVDIDDDEALPLAERDLPVTSVITGRPSRPRTHWWYRCPGAVTRQFKDPLTREMIIELRSTGAQTLVAPSVHPDSGEAYEPLEGQPGEVAYETLLAAVEGIFQEIMLRRHGDRSPKRPPRRAAPVASPVAASGDILKRATAYLDAIPGAVSRQGGHDQTYAAATAMVHGFGLDAETAFGLLWERYNSRCQPPWTERELRHKVEDAATKPHDRVHGWLRDAPLDDTDVPLHAASGVGNEPSEPISIARTDLGNSERLEMRFADCLRYCHSLGKWLRWDGRRWKEDDEGAPHRLAGETARLILHEAAANPDSAVRRKLAKWALSSESRGRLENMVALGRSRPELVVRADDLDADLWTMNVLNGTIDLRTGTLRPHRREDMITRLAPVEFLPGAGCWQFHTFLDRIFASDDNLIDYVQRLLGMCLTGDISEQFLPIFHGAGANGKSVLLDLVRGIMGEYASDAPPHLLTVTRHQQHPTEIADLKGRRLVVASETEDGAVLKLQLVKQLTGDATLKGRFMRQDFFSFRRTHKLVLVTNNKPRVREDSEAVWRRLRLVPFNVVIPKEERDPELLPKLLEEAAGVLGWLVQGCLAWQKEGLGEPPAVVEATSVYRSEEDNLGTFLEDRCVIDRTVPAEKSKLCAPWSDLRQEYEKWATASGEPLLSVRAFRDALDKRGHVSTTRRFGNKPKKARLGIEITRQQGRE